MPRRKRNIPPADPLDTLGRSFPGGDPDPDPEDRGAADDDPNGDDPLGDALELDSPEFADATWNLYRLNDDGTAPRGSKVGAFVCKLSGPLSQEAIKQTYGGGLYRVIGKAPNRGRLWTTFVIDGPKIAQPAVAPTPLQPGPSAILPLDAVAQLAADVRELKAQIANGGGQGQLQLFLAALQAARSMMPAPTPPLPVEPLLGLFQKGFDLGRNVEGGGSPYDWLRELAPVITQLVRPPAPAPAPHPTRAVPAPAATPPAPAGANGAPPAGSSPNRLIMFAEMLANGIRTQQDVNELASAAVSVMTEEELDQLEGTPAGVILNAMGPALRAQYPVLESAESLPYLERLQMALRAIPDDDPT